MVLESYTRCPFTTVTELILAPAVSACKPNLSLCRKLLVRTRSLQVNMFKLALWTKRTRGSLARRTTPLGTQLSLFVGGRLLVTPFITLGLALQTRTSCPVALYGRVVLSA